MLVQGVRKPGEFFVKPTLLAAWDETGGSSRDDDEPIESIHGIHCCWFRKPIFVVDFGARNLKCWVPRPGGPALAGPLLGVLMRLYFELQVLGYANVILSYCYGKCARLRKLDESNHI